MQAQHTPTYLMYSNPLLPYLPLRNNYRGTTGLQRLEMLSHSVAAIPPKTFGSHAHQQLMVNPDMSKQGCKVFIGGLVRTCYATTLRLVPGNHGPACPPLSCQTILSELA
jgi:hypothetical protein